MAVCVGVGSEHPVSVPARRHGECRVALIGGVGSEVLAERHGLFELRGSGVSYCVTCSKGQRAQSEKGLTVKLILKKIILRVAYKSQRSLHVVLDNQSYP